MTPIIPIPKVPVNIRPATMGDLPFIDSLQKLNTRQVGWMPVKQLEEKIAAGNVLVAEEVASDQWPVTSTNATEATTFMTPSSLATDHWPLATTPVGYVIGQDRYFKRDDCGIIYQMNVARTQRRKLVAATLLRAMFERSAYGCRLYCCWCAQDIEANFFWESMGFVPLAFRAGSQKKGRIHIFWQRRIRQGDTSTPYWFPCQTNSGSIREDRLVLPIPPGMHWSEVTARVLPTERDHIAETRGALARGVETRCAETRDAKTLGVKTQGATPLGAKALGVKPLQAMRVKALPVPWAKELQTRSSFLNSGGLRFQAPREVMVQDQPAPEIAPKPSHQPKPAPKPKRAREPKPKLKNDPKLIAAARELRDRWLEQVNSGQYLPAAVGKYEVARSLPAIDPAECPRLIGHTAIAA